MDELADLYSALPGLLPVLVVIAASVVGLWIADRLLIRRARSLDSSDGLPRQLAMLVLTAIAVVLIVLTMPISDATRGQLLGLLGLVVTAIIALSSTTFVANAMAGLMLRSVGSFRPGDFVRIGEHFGRVTERGLFHTEIQTEDRDLTTVPNLYLISQPVTVVRSSGTIVSATVSLGYDVSQHTVEPLLLDAAARAELDDPFVQVTELGNFAVSYRVAGFLTEVKHLLTARSTLRRKVLDTLHQAGVEIVSPTFMHQRPLADDVTVIPSEAAPSAPEAEPEEPPETLIFDKAEQAQSLEELRATHAALLGEIKELEGGLRELDEPHRRHREREIATRHRQAERIAARLEAATKEAHEDRAAES